MQYQIVQRGQENGTVMDRAKYLKMLQENPDMYALKDPYRPTQCANALLTAMLRVFRIETVQESKDGPGLLKATQRLWSKLYGFLVAPRTGEELDCMMKKLTKCNCKQRDRLSAKFYAEYRYDDDFKAATLERTGEEHLVVDHKYSPVGYQASNANFFVVHIFGTLFQVADLIPFGPDALVESMLQWDRVLDHAGVLRLAAPIFEICGAQIHPSIAKYDVTNPLALDPTKAFLDNIIDTLIASADDVDLKVYGWDESVWRMCSFYNYIAWIHGGIEGPEAMFQGGETKALQLCSIFLYLYSFLRKHSSNPSLIDGMNMKMSALGQDILRTFHMDRPGRLDVPLHPMIMSVYQFLTADGVDTVEQRIALAMVSSRVHQRCGSSGCDQTFAHIGGSFKFCQGCSVMGYCGHVCQEKDWRRDSPSYSSSSSLYPGPRHKRLCPILSRIMRRLGGWPEWKGRSLNNMVMDVNVLITHSALRQVIEAMRLDGKLSDDEMEDLGWWAEWTIERLRVEVPIRPDLNDGYEDYEDFIDRIVGPDGLSGLNACYAIFGDHEETDSVHEYETL
ncbi:hypothetical protein CVT24_009507 [Panaeolus cyanescens]|uniref:MYND-type domain-containing protein n=1 Tax=Panaeolus cyanescens TaxID=181874 RepID=A0A409VAH3_9AGAR|nr:hypothetical protein CVT24_009507 [Panaeolus cyanescens]